MTACVEQGCRIPAAPRRKRCRWHLVAVRPMEVQIAAAELRFQRAPIADRRHRVPRSEWPRGHRWCASCQTMVPLWYCTGTRCRACASAASHAGRILRYYGVTVERYRELLALQGGRCAICRRPPEKRVRLAVDHSHETGEPRGLLCGTCNGRLLGAANDSVDLLQAAISYLTDPPTSGRWSAPEHGLELIA